MEDTKIIHHSANTLSQDVYLRLKQDIYDFRMPPGQRYSENELATMLQVSRTPLRLALHILAHEGYLQNLGGHSAWQVLPLDLSFYEDLYDFRLEIEMLAIRRIDGFQSSSAFATLREFWSAPVDKRLTDSQLVAQQDEQFHLSLVGLAGNKAMLRAFADLTDRIRIIRRLDFTSPTRIQATYEEHIAILNAIEASQIAEAEQLIRRHIETSRTEIRHLTFHNLSIARSAGSANRS